MLRGKLFGKKWEEFINLKKINANKVDPNEFIRWTYAKALSHRQPRYEKNGKMGNHSQS